MSKAIKVGLLHSSQQLKVGHLLWKFTAIQVYVHKYGNKQQLKYIHTF